LFVGKTFYLRGGYLDNSLSFDEHGRLTDHSAVGSYTLSGIEINRIHLTKHKVELDGVRYGLHFLGALPYEDPTKAVDRVRITPKKKFVKITIDRELIVTPKKKKQKGDEKNAKVGPGGVVMPAESVSQPTGQPAADQASAKPAEDQPSAQPSSDQASAQPAADQPSQASAAQPASDQANAAASAAGQQPADSTVEQSDVDQARAEMASAPVEERPADAGSVTTTTSPAHAAKVLTDAIDHIFAQGLDDKMMASMPDFWKLYYQAAEAKTDYRPDAGVFRQGSVDQKAKLTSAFVPESNDYAQDAGVAGMALYHAVIGTDGKPQEIAVARPIGFGLDENAVATIRKASFEPALKDGKPVPVMIDLEVVFRIYSKRTNVASKPEDRNKPHDPLLPGPYTLRDPGQPVQTQSQVQNQ
jgi:TonB family protein